jgi:flagellin-like hook-associated protein FlgL
LLSPNGLQALGELYAAETADASKNQMLAQAGTSMLKQTSSLAQLTLSLIAT